LDTNQLIATGNFGRKKNLFCVVVNQFRKQIISATIAELGEIYTTFDKISNKLDIGQLIATGYLGQEKQFFCVVFNQLRR